MEHDLAPIADHELARRTRAGSISAFEELVRRYEDRVFRLTAGFTRNEADARELTQDTFLKAFQSIGQFQGEKSFAAWIFTIARRKCIDHFRVQPPNGESLDPETPGTGNPAEVLTEREDGDNLWKFARRSLSGDEFQVLWLKYMEGLSFDEIAQVLGKSRTATKVLAFRARRSLARKLAHGDAARLDRDIRGPRSSPVPKIFNSAINRKEAHP